MNLPNDERAAEPAAATAAVKFIYPSGARPLPGYTLKRGLGRGGFGEVYFATSDAGKEVALKLVRRNLDIELRGVQQCLNLKHPHLIALYDIRQDEHGDSWVVMEYVAGQSLEERLAAHPNGLPEHEALSWFRGLCAAVAYLHDHGIVHRDLKPGNVFCDGVSIDSGTVKLGDYGLSKFISVSRRSGQTESVGTVHYMAPEIANGRYGKEIDLYALGIMLYELLTGRVPFEGESVGEVLMKHLTAEPELAGVQEPYRSVIAACVAKDPAERPSSVAAIEAMLAASPCATQQEIFSHSPPSASSAQHRRWGASWHGAWSQLTESQQVAMRCAILAGALVAAILVVSPLRAVGYELFVAPLARVAPATLTLGLVLMSMLGFGVNWLSGRAGLPRRESHAPPRESRHDRPTELHRGNDAIATIQVGPLRRGSAIVTSELVNRRSRRELLADWTGSLLLAAIVAAAVCWMLVLLRGERPTAEIYAWLTCSTVFGAWLLLTLARVWESRSIEPVWQRFSSTLIGLAYGLLAWLIDQALLVDLPYDARATAWVGHAFFDSAGQPELFAYMTYYGLLFLAIRWWRQTEIHRSSRVRVWYVFCSLCGAWIVSWLAPFPYPWSLYSAFALTLTVQLAAPWRPGPQLRSWAHDVAHGQWFNA